MLQKKKGPRLDALRSIHILEADFQLLMKIAFGKEPLNSLEKRNYINLEAQFGLRKGRSVYNVILGKLLILEESKFLLKPGAW